MRSPKHLSVPPPRKSETKTVADEPINIQEIIDPQIVQMEVGEYTDAEGLFTPECWAALSPSQHKGVGTMVSNLVAQGKASLVRDGFGRNRQNRYRKI
jgi:hypothetical protein